MEMRLRSSTLQGNGSKMDVLVDKWSVFFGEIDRCIYAGESNAYISDSLARGSFYCSLELLPAK